MLFYYTCLKNKCLWTRLERGVYSPSGPTLGASKPEAVAIEHRLAYPTLCLEHSYTRVVPRFETGRSACNGYSLVLCSRAIYCTCLVFCTSFTWCIAMVGGWYYSALGWGRAGTTMLSLSFSCRMAFQGTTKLKPACFETFKNTSNSLHHALL